MSKLFRRYVPEYILEFEFFGGLFWSIKIQEHVHFLVLQFFLIKFADVVNPWNLISTEVSLKVDHNIVLSFVSNVRWYTLREDNSGVNEHFTFIHF